MKKSLVKKLVRMAKDGDPEAIEALAEMLEAVAEPETPAEAAVEEVTEKAAEAVTEAVAEAAEEPAAVIETPEATIVVDEAALGEVISRLDQIIALLTPAAQDEGAEEIAEAVEEAVEAVLAETSEEAGAPDIVTPEEIGEMIGEILDPVSEVVEENTDQCGEEKQEVIASGDALKAALRVVAPALAKLPKKQRIQVSADIAARLNGKPTRRGADGRYTALAALAKGGHGDPKELGRRIMASRSANKPRN